MPNMITLFYLTAYVFSLLYSGYDSFKNVNGEEHEFKAWLNDLKRKKECYLEILPHVFDTATDCGIIFEFFMAAYFRDKECYDINMEIIFWLTVSVFILYRSVTSVQIYLFTKDSKRAILQFIFDYELIRACTLNYRLYKIDHSITKPCDAQKWISTLEATFESGPEFVIQLYFVAKSNLLLDFSNPLFHISLLASLFTLISHNVNDDQLLDIKAVLHTTIRLYIFRFIDITNRLFTIVMFWMYQPLYLAVMLPLYIAVLVPICIYTKHYEFLNGIIRYEISSTDPGYIWPDDEGWKYNLKECIHKSMNSTAVMFLQLFDRIMAMPFLLFVVIPWSGKGIKKPVNVYEWIVVIYIWVTTFWLWIVVFKLKFEAGASASGKSHTSRNMNHLIKSENWEVLNQYVLFGFCIDWENASLDFFEKYIFTRDYFMLQLILEINPSVPSKYPEHFSRSICTKYENKSLEKRHFVKIFQLFVKSCNENLPCFEVYQEKNQAMIFFDAICDNHKKRLLNAEQFQNVLKMFVKSCNQNLPYFRSGKEETHYYRSEEKERTEHVEFLVSICNRYNEHILNWQQFQCVLQMFFQSLIHHSESYFNKHQVTDSKYPLDLYRPFVSFILKQYFDKQMQDLDLQWMLAQFAKLELGINYDVLLYDERKNVIKQIDERIRSVDAVQWNNNYDLRSKFSHFVHIFIVYLQWEVILIKNHLSGNYSGLIYEYETNSEVNISSLRFVQLMIELPQKILDSRSIMLSMNIALSAEISENVSIDSKMLVSHLTDVMKSAGCIVMNKYRFCIKKAKLFNIEFECYWNDRECFDKLPNRLSDLTEAMKSAVFECIEKNDKELKNNILKSFKVSKDIVVENIQIQNVANVYVTIWDIKEDDIIFKQLEKSSWKKDHDSITSSYFSNSEPQRSPAWKEVFELLLDTAMRTKNKPNLSKYLQYTFKWKNSKDFKGIDHHYFLDLIFERKEYVTDLIQQMRDYKSPESLFRYFEEMLQLYNVYKEKMDECKQEYNDCEGYDELETMISEYKQRKKKREDERKRDQAERDRQREIKEQKKHEQWRFEYFEEKVRIEYFHPQSFEEHTGFSLAKLFNSNKYPCCKQENKDAKGCQQRWEFVNRDKIVFSDPKQGDETFADFYDRNCEQLKSYYH